MSKAFKAKLHKTSGRSKLAKRIGRKRYEAIVAKRVGYRHHLKQQRRKGKK